MDYKKKQVEIQSNFFRGKCGGWFNAKQYDFILRDECRKDNLYSEIEDEAINYFKKNIVWWKGKDGLPTNHILSSQISCVNHLFWVKNNEKAANIVLRQIDEGYTAVSFPRTGNYVEFELNGCDDLHNNYLGEKARTKGSNSTSIDAAMLAVKNNKIILVFIEWKYVEHYSQSIEAAKKTSQYNIQKNTYKNFLLAEDCPISINKNNLDKEYEKFSVNPFYQLMRQTLLAWRLCSDRRYGAEEYIHVDVIPYANTKLLSSKTSPDITKGYQNICTVWSSLLKDPSKYIHIDPNKLLCNIADFYKDLFNYLSSRYWQ